MPRVQDVRLTEIKEEGETSIKQENLPKISNIILKEELNKDKLGFREGNEINDSKRFSTQNFVKIKESLNSKK